MLSGKEKRKASLGIYDIRVPHPPKKTQRDREMDEQG